MATSFNGEWGINFKEMNDHITHLITCICFVFVISIFFSCSKDGCSFTAEAISSQSRNVSSFNQIILYDKINVILKEDSVQSITVDANKTLLPGISTDVSNNILTIKNDNHCTLLTNPDQQVNVYISTLQLQNITYYGAGNINSVNTLHPSQFTVDCWTGTGAVKLDIVTNSLSVYIRTNNAQVTLSGQSNTTVIYCAAEGYINMFQLPSVNLTLNQRSVRDIDINVTGSLNADVVYKGNVFYMGNPVKIDSLITNTGRLIHVQ